MGFVKTLVCKYVDFVITMISYGILTYIGFWSYLMFIATSLGGTTEHSSHKKSSNTKPKKGMPNFKELYSTTLPSVADYVRAQGLTYEEHSIDVSTNHVAVLHHIYDGESSVGKHPIVLQHGLFQKGGIFVCSGKHSAAFFFARKGLDVWVPNIRGIASDAKKGQQQKHVKDEDLWDWSLRELICEDFDAVLSYVSERTLQKPIWLGHSQGATQALVACSIDAKVSEKLSMFIGLAPGFYSTVPKHCSVVVPFLAGIPRWLRYMLLGNGQFFPFVNTFQRFVPSYLFGLVSIHAAHFMFRWKTDLWPKKHLGSFFQFSAAPISSRLMCDWLANNSAGGIVVNPEVNNKMVYEPPEMHCPCAVIWGEEDELVDCQRLAKQLEKRMPGSLVSSFGISDYAHLDVIWARDAEKLVFEPLWNVIQEQRIVVC